MLVRNMELALTSKTSRSKLDEKAENNLSCMHPYSIRRKNNLKYVPALWLMLIVLVALLFTYPRTVSAEVEIAQTNTIFAANGIVTKNPEMMPQGFINIYMYRDPSTIAPLLELFTKQTGIRTRVVVVSQGSDEMLKRQGLSTSVDIIISDDIVTLDTMSKEGLLVRVYDIGVRNNIPSYLTASDESWFAISTRAQAIYTTKSGLGKLPDNFTYMNLADPKYKGQICLSSGERSNNNMELLALMIGKYGESVAEEWLIGLKNNLARKPKGSDRTQLKDLNRGLCTIALANSRYLGMAMSNLKERSIVDNTVINFPVFSDKKPTTFVTMTTIGVARYATNKQSALRFLEFMLSVKAQRSYASINYEYPSRKELLPPRITQSWGEIVPSSNFKKVISNYSKAVDMAARVDIDL